MTERQPYHEAEIALQERTGRRSLAEALAPRIWDKIVPEVLEFLPNLPFAVAGSLDDAGRPWASILAGPPGFMAPDENTLRIHSLPDVADPLRANLSRGGDFGLIAIDFSQRRRFRINGRASATDDGILLNVAQCYRNCPQYIHARQAIFDCDRASGSASTSRRMETLDDEMIRIISQADTFFIATHGSGQVAIDPRLGADVSHRGGNPGFVTVDADRRRLSFPDYIGNFMFNTLGNLTRYPRCGLLFVDFATGATLQVTGRTDVDWELARATTVPGAQRIIDLEIDEAVLAERAVPLSWKLIEPARDLKRYRIPSPIVAQPSMTDVAARPSTDGFIPVVVSRIVDEADHIRSFYLRSKHGSLSPFLAGQYVRVKLTAPGLSHPIIRHYSLSSYDPSPKEYRIGVRRSNNRTPGSGSNLLHDAVYEGAELDIGPPEGSFTLSADAGRPIALISVGSGITPVLGMLHALAVERDQRPVWFVHGARHGAEHAYASEIRRLSDRFPHIKAHFRYSRPRDIDFMGRDHDSVGRIDIDMLMEMIPRDAEFYLCGPSVFMSELRTALHDRGISRESIHVEAFGAGSAKAAGAAAGLSGAKVLFTGTATEAVWGHGFESLLELGEAAELALAHSCRAGSCGTCEHVLEQGQVGYATEPLFETRPGHVLLCCAHPLSNVVIRTPSQSRT
jgi:ferredoxin-NADP reductase/predicted pyridoxine 5'-phosphate oxidase superfamily flavin-nucleotide-binding protein